MIHQLWLDVRGMDASNLNLDFLFVIFELTYSNHFPPDFSRYTRVFFFIFFGFIRMLACKL